MMSTTLQLLIGPGGVVRCLYTERIKLAVLGRPVISRASHVEPDSQGRWLADLSPVGGPVLGPFDLRSRALAAEQEWLETNWLVPCDHATNDPARSSKSQPAHLLHAER